MPSAPVRDVILVIVDVDLLMKQYTVNIEFYSLCTSSNLT